MTAPATPPGAESRARLTVDAYRANNGPLSADVCNAVVAGYYAGLADAAPATPESVMPSEALNEAYRAGWRACAEGKYLKPPYGIDAALAADPQQEPK